MLDKGQERLVRLQLDPVHRHRRDRGDHRRRRLGVVRPRRFPIVDLQLFKDRNFAIASGLLFMLGLVLFGSTVLLPLMLQTLFGYTAPMPGWCSRRGRS